MLTATPSPSKRPGRPDSTEPVAGGEPASLDDKYTQTSGSVYLSGVQALVRLCIIQRMRDARAGLNTAGYVSGYRGSPLGGLDEALWKAKTHLKTAHVNFMPGINEDLAATSVWGTQQVHLLGESRYDGVFGLWYGKGPGVDRSADVLKHMNHAGTARHGGVLLVAGDDHGAYSSTLPHQSDHVFAASMIPMLYPCNVAEYIELGLHGWAMSRFSGCAIGFKALADTVESSATIASDPYQVQTLIPDDFEMPEGGLNCRLSTDTLGVQARKQEALMQDYKIYAAMAYARANRLNRLVINAPNAKLGIIASGKSYMDVLEALEELGIDEALADHIGIRLFKVSMPWPLEPEGVREFAQGLEEILVVEEKRQVVEYQLKEQLYNWKEDVRPRVIGKFDERGEWPSGNKNIRGDWLLPAKADFSVAQVARVIAARVKRLPISASTESLVAARLMFLEAKEQVLKKSISTPVRPAYYCSGCPHNTSTKVPEGSFALAGIGCHVMATAIYPEFNRLTTHMGGEGAPWIGAAAFSKVSHVFSNIGDGTYFHSGYLAIRAAVAANRTTPVNITYKILYNDAVAMTGGQAVDGPLDVFAVARQLDAEGVKRIALVTEDTSRYKDMARLPSSVTLHRRDEIEAVQLELRELPGVSALIYDQVCAAEKRRRRKKKLMQDPPKRTFINEAVCEGCGDCGIQSNCTSILPLETELGRKRQIDQSSCNKDFSCTSGFCPSFLTIRGGSVKKISAPRHAFEDDIARLPLPELLPLLERQNHNILVAGIGGTGVITLGALLGMAAHLEGKGVSVLDMTGMSQKNGSVTSHVRIATAPCHIRAQRIPRGEADLLLGCDMLTAGGYDAISKLSPHRTLALVNTHEQAPGPFARQRDWTFPKDEIMGLIAEAVEGRMEAINATELATQAFGDSIGANLLMLGYAFQRGAIPLAYQSLMRAIELNGVAIESNKLAFNLGRLAAVDKDKIQALLTPPKIVQFIREKSLDQIVADRVQRLTAYQNEKYARNYASFVEHISKAVNNQGLKDKLSKLVAQNLFKLMAYKDEYEVARLLSSDVAWKNIAEQFEGNYSVSFNLAPPLISRRNRNGELIKREYGPWLRHAMRQLAKLKILRGGVFDLFGRTAERRAERALIVGYKNALLEALPSLSAQTYARFLKLANVPDELRGFGHVKEKSMLLFNLRLRTCLADIVQTNCELENLHDTALIAAVRTMTDGASELIGSGSSGRELTGVT